MADTIHVATGSDENKRSRERKLPSKFLAYKMSSPEDTSTSAEDDESVELLKKFKADKAQRKIEMEKPYQGLVVLKTGKEDPGKLIKSVKKIGTGDVTAQKKNPTIISEEILADTKAVTAIDKTTVEKREMKSPQMAETPNDISTALRENTSQLSELIQSAIAKQNEQMTELIQSAMAKQKEQMTELIQSAMAKQNEQMMTMMKMARKSKGDHQECVGKPDNLDQVIMDEGPTHFPVQDVANMLAMENVDKEEFIRMVRYLAKISDGDVKEKVNLMIEHAMSLKLRCEVTMNGTSKKSKLKGTKLHKAMYAAACYGIAPVSHPARRTFNKIIEAALKAAKQRMERKKRKVLAIKEKGTEVTENGTITENGTATENEESMEDKQNPMDALVDYDVSD